mgnify:CR=1 FL=1
MSARRVDTLILGAGAAGLMCAAHAGPSTLVVDHAKAAGDKIRISGGGRCNFTNLHVSPERYLSANPHFCKSALARYTQWDFIDWVERSGIDPALAGSVILTTVTDVVGFFAFLGLATLLLI